MRLETLLHDQREVTITNIFFRHHLAFFRIGDESFCTGAGHIHHQSSPMFDHPVLRIQAKNEHDPEAVKQQERTRATAEYEVALWEKHRRRIYKTLIDQGAAVLREHGEEALEQFMDHHLDIIPLEATMCLVKKMEDDEH